MLSKAVLNVVEILLEATAAGHLRLCLEDRVLMPYVITVVNMMRVVLLITVVVNHCHFFFALALRSG